ncbi:2-hydroxyacyl-CoA dehydratase family protein [Streptomyces sp. S465]|uniref:2-hydroxyacyl-CoA dehydratase family protein n=1 Tax=Streptomyces sp. S465 TaxID=2979468 RepID=UPI0022A82C67|nr:2-hydroxyacyl-CoA dehydratase family protein [Streptomyces sp. S465]WAP53562.1 2-hydroxyacyl-CoA dehydratase family protein [Streptomyces sp. S465]
MNNRQRLTAAGDALRHQREWFAGLRTEAERGVPLALVNADAPHEIFRAMGVPYVVNQWWSSIISAKRMSGRYLEALRDRGLPDDVEQYSALPLAEALAPRGDDAPWGGLPLPTVVVAECTGDNTRRMFSLWESELGVPFVPLESAAAETVPTDWWNLMRHDWETAIGRDRVDLLHQELQAVIPRLERLTGATYDAGRLAEIMALSNEQAEWNRRTRDLLAQAPGCPVPVNDIIPAVMIPQWHRGTPWATAAAESLYREVRSLVDEGRTVVPRERRRLMWIGRGLWFDMDFYRSFEQSHGAVFVWSMYLALAADAYARYGDDPLRALAARFCAFRDQMYTPPWSVEWYVKEARAHRVDGVVHLVSPDSRSSWFTTHALETAGIPVIEIRADNSDSRALDPAELHQRVARWIESLDT